MAGTRIDRLMFAQGGRCFFCEGEVPRDQASVEHLVAKANGGNNAEHNLVACCTTLNAWLGSLTLKEKLKVILSQPKPFKCPGKLVPDKRTPAKPPAAVREKADNYARVLKNLRDRRPALPSTLKALTSTINSLFNNTLTAQEVAALVARLKAEKVVSASGTRISYLLDGK